MGNKPRCSTRPIGKRGTPKRRQVIGTPLHIIPTPETLRARADSLEKAYLHRWKNRAEKNRITQLVRSLRRQAEQLEREQQEKEQTDGTI